MAIDTEVEIAHCDFREFGELKLTNHRLWGRIRMSPTPDQLRSGANIITTTKGKFYERDFNAPVTTIEKMEIPPPPPLWFVCAVFGFGGGVLIALLALLIWGVVVAGVCLLAGAIVSVVLYWLIKREIINFTIKKYVFSFVGNGEPIKLPFDVNRVADIEMFMEKIQEAKKNAMN